MKKYFFDITSTSLRLKKHRSFSGIQRVVATLAAETAQIVGPERVFLLIHNGKEFKAISASELSYEIISNPELLKRSLHKRPFEAFRVPSTLLKYKENKIKLTYHSIRYFIKSIHQFSGKISEFNVFLNYKNKNLTNIEDFAPRLKLIEIIEDGDIILSLDSSWSNAISDALMELRSERRVKVFTMVHDLIPLVKPFSAAPSVQYSFVRWLEKSTEFTDKFLANSINTKTDLQKYFRARGERDFEIETVPLAQFHPTCSALKNPCGIGEYISLEYPDAAEAMKLRDHIRYAIDSEYVICVGTLEIRKNIYRLARAWKVLSEAHPDMPRLIFAGKRGWGIESFENLLKATGNISGLVTIIDSPSDDELRILYKNCKIFAYPSTYEGWGLPVGEALGYGKTGVISDNSSLPEVGQDLVEYCDASSVDSIVKAFERMLFEPGVREEKEIKIASRSLRNWTDVARDLIEAVNS